MFIGHVATALAAKKIDPRPSLGTYLLAATWPDVLFSLLLLGGWEQVQIAPGHTAMMAMAFPHYPYSHSLVGVAGAGALLALLYWIFRRNTRAALILGGLVLGNWILDVSGKWKIENGNICLYYDKTPPMHPNPECDKVEKHNVGDKWKLNGRDFELAKGIAK